MTRGRSVRALPRPPPADDVRKRLSEIRAEGDVFEALNDAENGLAELLMSRRNIPAVSAIERLKIKREEAQHHLNHVNAELRSAFVTAYKGGVQVDLLEWIEVHLCATGTPATRFGKDVMGDPSFVRNLREGRKLRPQTDELVRRHLAG